MEFVDRNSKYPNRYTMRDQNGNESLVYLERADEPIVEGTPLNAETFNSLLLCTESKDYPGCYFRIVDGEEEWLNPPMMENKAYRTTKRFNGYPVYMVAAVFPTLAVEGGHVEKKFSGFTISNVLNMSTIYVPHIQGVSIYGDPYVESSGLLAVTRIMDGFLQVRSIKDMSSYSATCVIEFTKAEEAL